MKTIFRSWNWPSYDSDTFSQRPTPYHISKNSYLNPGSVYKEWNTIFARNFVKKVISHKEVGKNPIKQSLSSVVKLGNHP